MLVQICRWLFRHLAPWQRNTDRISEPLQLLCNKIQFTMQGEQEGHLRFLHIDIYRKMDSLLGHRVFRKPTHTNLYLHQKNNQSWLLWYTEPKLSVTRIPSPKNWNFSPPFSMILDTALSRYDDPWKLHHRLPTPMINLPTSSFIP